MGRGGVHRGGVSGRRGRPWGAAGRLGAVVGCWVGRTWGVGGGCALSWAVSRGEPGVLWPVAQGHGVSVGRAGPSCLGGYRPSWRRYTTRTPRSGGGGSPSSALSMVNPAAGRAGRGASLALPLSGPPGHAAPGAALARRSRWLAEGWGGGRGQSWAGRARALMNMQQQAVAAATSERGSLRWAGPTRNRDPPLRQVVPAGAEAQCPAPSALAGTTGPVPPPFPKIEQGAPLPRRRA